MHDSYAHRITTAPVQQAQAWERLARFQYTIAGDLLEHNLAGMQAMMSAATPAEYFVRQGQLNVRFVQRVANHTREFLRQAGEHSTPGSATSTEPSISVADDEIACTDELAPSSAEEETVRVAEESVQDERLEPDIQADESAVESIETQLAESSKPRPTTARQRKKRSNKSRRGQAHQ
jgi:Phasin protein